VARIVIFGAFSFTPRLWPTVAAALLIALTLWLGRWQTSRAHEKDARQALLDARIRETPVMLTGSVDAAEPLLYRRVRAAGAWVPEGQVLIDNQVVAGRAGYHVITPLRLEGRGESVLVNRGWIARTARYPVPPEVAVPAGRVEVAGMATLPPKRFLELSAAAESGNVWQNLSIERYRSRTGRAILPFVVLADPAPAGLVAVREAADAGAAKHREYALTWFSLAVTALALWIVLNTRKAR
jgi:surfeit locus 1 family protein